MTNELLVQPTCAKCGERMHDAFSTCCTACLLIAAMQKARPMVAGILRRCPNDIPDVIQEAALTALRSASAFRGDNGCSYNSWFCRIAINRALMHLRPQRQKATHVEMDFESLVGNWDSPETLAIQQERASKLQEAIDNLSPMARRGALDWLHEEPVSSNTLKGRRHHAKTALRQRLGALQ
jgi:RNA polymerase sigma factor (sigma-70 family)